MTDTKNATRVSPEIQSLLDSQYVAPTGRIKDFILNPEYKTNAPSCMLRVWDKKIGLGAMVSAISYYIRKGAGVKIQFGAEKVVFWEAVPIVWNFYCDPSHPDIDKMSQENKEVYVDKQKWGEILEKQNMSSDKNVAIIFVGDDMDSIEGSWRSFIDAALLGKQIFLDLSAIRQAGEQTSTKTVSTGIFGLGSTDTGFIEIYRWLAKCIESGDVGSVLQLLNGICKVLARGGTTKKRGGIVTTAMDYTNPDIEEYLNYPLSKILGGSKKGIRYSSEIFSNTKLVNLVIEKVNNESLMLEKIKAPGLYANVCMGIYLEDKASCLVSPVNAGQIEKPEDLPEALCAVVKLLALIHYSWRDAVNANPELYLPANEDRQIAVGWLGWANFLRRQGVTYLECANSMRALRLNDTIKYLDNGGSYKGVEIASWLKTAYEKGAEIGGEFNLERIYSIEPNQRVYLDYKDIDGFTTCRNINPPYSRTQVRASEVYGDAITEHGDVEVMSEVGHDTIQLLWEEFQLLAEYTGLAHAGSFDIHRRIDKDWFEDFTLRSPLPTTYYQMADSVNQEYLNKGIAMTAQCEEEICMVCGEG
jgi:hypothetical protein